MPGNATFYSIKMIGHDSSTSTCGGSKIDQLSNRPGTHHRLPFFCSPPSEKKRAGGAYPGGCLAGQFFFPPKGWGWFRVQSFFWSKKSRFPASKRKIKRAPKL